MAPCTSCLVSKSSNRHSQHFCDVCKYMFRMDWSNGHKNQCSNHAQWSSDDSRHTLWIHDLSIDYCAHCFDPFWTCICIHHRSAESGDWMISTTNKTCEKPLQSNEWININGLHTTLVITVSKQWSNYVAKIQITLYCNMVNQSLFARYVLYHHKNDNWSLMLFGCFWRLKFQSWVYKLDTYKQFCRTDRL